MKTRRITVAVLIILTLLAFLDAKIAWPGSEQRQRAPIRIEINQTSEITQTRIWEFQNQVAEFKTLIFNNSFGQVKVERSETEELKVIGKIGTFEKDPELAEKTLATWQIEEIKEGSQISYQLTGPGGISQVAVDYVIWVPEGMEIIVEQEYGNFAAAGLKNDLKIKGRYTAIEIEKHKGDLEMETRFSNLKLVDIAGPLTIKDAYSSIVLAAVDWEPNYDMKLELTNTSLAGDSPDLVRQSNQVHEYKSSYGTGTYPVNISANFGTLKLDLGLVLPGD